MKRIIAALTLATLTACSPAAEHEDHTMADEGIVISDAWVRPPMPGRDIATAYFHIENKSGANDRLVSVTTDVNSRTEIHTHLNEEGVMKMRKLDGLDLPKDESAMFKPGGLHIMMFDTALGENDSDVALILSFEKSGALTVIADVKDMAPAKKMDHSGH